MGKSERLSVNVTRGTVTTGRGRGASEDDKVTQSPYCCKCARDDDVMQVYSHEEVLQLIKSRSNKNKLAILFKGKRRKDYLFKDLQVSRTPLLPPMGV